MAFSAITKWRQSSSAASVCLFLCGDLMTGRGIDQVLAHPCKPHLYEPCVKDSLSYVQLAENATGPLPALPVDYKYIWGDALKIFDDVHPDVRIVNLETSVTTSEDHWIDKGIHYRMHPKNVNCLTAAKIDCCMLANNHVLDWGHRGLEETLHTLHEAGILTTGAGRTRAESECPAIIELIADKNTESSKDGQKNNRVLVYGFGDESSGVFEDWASTSTRSGVNVLDSINRESAERIARRISQDKQPGDVVVVSIHWGGNWGYEISKAQCEFARTLIDLGVDIVHGHSSHHVKGIEVYHGKLILYGCGDFLNDYEGIAGYEKALYRDDLTLMYFPVVSSADGTLISLTLFPLEIKHFRLNRADEEGVNWLHATLERECRKFNESIHIEKGKQAAGLTSCMTLHWK